MRFIFRLTAIVTLLLAFTVAGGAASFSFTGNFIHDNDVQLFTFTLLSPGTVTLQTWAYGGGTNAAGQVISPGGFESILGVFDAPSGLAEGSPIFPGPDPTCAPRNPDPNLLPVVACFDAFAQVSLPAGNYFLSLTQNANAPLGNLSDGFFYTTAVPDPNFNNNFVGTFGFQRDNHWAVDIVSVDAASELTAAPEPASAALFAGAAILAGFWRRRLARN